MPAAYYADKNSVDIVRIIAGNIKCTLYTRTPFQNIGKSDDLQRSLSGENTALIINMRLGGCIVCSYKFFVELRTNNKVRKIEDYDPALKTSVCVALL